MREVTIKSNSFKDKGVIPKVCVSFENEERRINKFKFLFSMEKFKELIPNAVQ